MVLGGDAKSADDVKNVLNDMVKEVKDSDFGKAVQNAVGDKPFAEARHEVIEREDAVEREINEDGYVWQRRLWRRHVMAQMFRMLHNLNRNLPISETNYDLCLRRRGDGYAWRVLQAEMHAQAKLSRDDREQFEERNRWFNRGVVEEIARQMGSGGQRVLNALAGKGDDPDALYNAVLSTRGVDGAKCAAWLNAYKGSGAYFTMKNMILFHDCRVHQNGMELDHDASLRYLQDLNRRPGLTANEMFAEMLKLIRDNNFDWKRR